MKAAAAITSEALLGIGRLGIAWIVFQIVYFLSFAVGWFMAGAGWRPSMQPMVIKLGSSIVAAALFVRVAERLSGRRSENS